MNQAQVDSKLWDLTHILRTVSQGMVLQPGDSEEEVHRRLRAYAGAANMLIPTMDRILLDAAHLITREQRDFLVRGKGVLCVAVERAKGLGA